MDYRHWLDIGGLSLAYNQSVISAAVLSLLEFISSWNALPTAQMPRGRFEVVPHPSSGESLIEDPITQEVYVWRRRREVWKLESVGAPKKEIAISPRQLPIGMDYEGQVISFDYGAGRVVRKPGRSVSGSSYRLPVIGRAEGEFYANSWDGATELYLRDSRFARLDIRQDGWFLDLEVSPQLGAHAFLIKPSPSGGVLTRFNFRDKSLSRLDLRPVNAVRLDERYAHSDFDFLKYPWLMGYIEATSDNVSVRGMPVLELWSSRAPHARRRTFALCFINVETGLSGAFAFVVSMMITS